MTHFIFIAIISFLSMSSNFIHIEQRNYPYEFICSKESKQGKASLYKKGDTLIIAYDKPNKFMKQFYKRVQKKSKIIKRIANQGNLTFNEYFSEYYKGPHYGIFTHNKDTVSFVLIGRPYIKGENNLYGQNAGKLVDKISEFTPLQKNLSQRSVFEKMQLHNMDFDQTFSTIIVCCKLLLDSYSYEEPSETTYRSLKYSLIILDFISDSLEEVYFSFIKTSDGFEKKRFKHYVIL